MQKTTKILAAVGCSAAVLAVQSIASATFLVDFNPITQDTNMSYAGPTAATQTLTITSPVVRLRSVLDVGFVPISGDGYYTYNNTTLTLSGLTTNSGLLSGTTFLNQGLSVGTFTFTGAAIYGSPILLTGTFVPVAGVNPANVVNGVVNSSVGAVGFSSVSYTGGLIYTQLLAVGGTATGDAIFNASQVSHVGGPGFATTSLSGTSYLSDFTARVQGQFTTPVIPEPTSAGVVGVASLAVLSRRRRA